jgi:hypothetical protein
MRNFRDSNDIEWTVFEVRRQAPSKGELAFLPSGFNDGWLCFENAASKRRLTRYPERWRELADTDLEQLLQKASPAPRAAWRIDNDLDGTSPDSLA